MYIHCLFLFYEQSERCAADLLRPPTVDFGKRARKLGAIPR